MLDLGQVRSFLEVAERGTVASAAAALGFTPPAVSQHLAKLEAELDAALFDRVGRRLRLTNAGRALVPIGLEMLDLDFRSREAVQRPAQLAHVVIAGFASALATIVIPRLADMGAHMTAKILEQEDAAALRDLRLGSVDLVLTQEYEGFDTPRDERFVFTALRTDELRLVLPATMSVDTTLESLADHPWLINGEDTRCSAATTRLLQAAGAEPTIAASVADNNTLLDLVAAGHGVTVVPDLLLRTPRPGITVADQQLAISRTILAVHRRVASRSIAPLLELLAA